MDTATMTLADFLLARITEDEANAYREMIDVRTMEDLAAGRDRFVPGALKAGDAQVLAECSTKRHIISLHRPHEIDAHYCATCGGLDRNDSYFAVDWPCDTLKALTLPYSEHPDYRQKWAL